MFANPFSLAGRVSRQTWWLYSSVLTTLSLTQYFWIQRIDAITVSLMVLMVWVGICNNVKRYHDVGKSGFWIFIGLIPIVGSLWMSVELGFTPSDYGENRFGPEPGKGAEVKDTLSRYAEMSDEEFRVMASNALRQAEPIGAAPVAQRLTTPATTSLASQSSHSNAPTFGRRGIVR
jgi:uncharacterized membrane protein YhaH (DUF805 family)